MTTDIINLDSQREAVLKYYEATYSDYKNLWTGKNDLAIHFGYYDNATQTHQAALVRMNEILAQYAQIQASDNVIDAGCGYGGSALWLAQALGCNVTGITIVPFQVEIGQQNILKRNLADKVNILQRDYTHTQLPSESFDVYWALESIVHAADRQQVLNEAFRLLGNDGRLMIAEYTYREATPLSPSEKEYMQPWLQGWSMPELLTPTQYMAQLAKAGFQDIQYHDITSHVKPSLRRLKIMCQLCLPGARFLEALKIFSKERVANVAGSLRQAQSLDKNLWNYSIFTAKKL